MKIDIKELIKNSESLDELLSAIDEKARDADPYEYGLPMYDEGQKSIMRNIVLQWLLRFED